MSALEIVLQQQAAGGTPVILDRDGREQRGRENEERLDRCLRGLRRVPGSRARTADVADEEVDVIIGRTHDPRYVDFLARTSRGLAVGEFHIDEGHVAPGVNADTPIIAGTFTTAREAVRTAIAAARLVISGKQRAYALCRPPGHHAGPSWFGGYCYLNNAVAAALTLRAAGVGHVGILDVDYHLGNGSAALAAALPGVFYGSIHASTIDNYPYQPTAPLNDRQVFSAFDRPPSPVEYLESLESVLDSAAAVGCAALVVSIGYDIVVGDPHGSWSLPVEIFQAVGSAIANRGLPLCFVQEGGYRLDALEACAFHLGAGLGAGGNGRRLYEDARGIPARS